MAKDTAYFSLLLPEFCIDAGARLISTHFNTFRQKERKLFPNEFTVHGADDFNMLHSIRNEAGTTNNAILSSVHLEKRHDDVQRFPNLHKHVHFRGSK